MVVTTIRPGSEEAARKWWAFAFYLPGDAASARVKIWRRLQDIGAASFKKALYLLPANDDTLEDLEWTMKEVTAAGGQGVILQGTVVEGLSDAEIAALFDAARETQYRELADEVRKLQATLDRPRGRAQPSDLPDLVVRLRERLSAIEGIDFFQANGREQAKALIDTLEARVSEALRGEDQSAADADAKADLVGRVWVTRANIHVDRMASAWLIARSIDQQARFKFVTKRNYEPAPGELRFDMYDAEYTHDADRCTFEVLLDLIVQPDAGLRRIAEIVHDLDIRDRKYQHPETAGIKVMLDGLIANHDRDEDRIERASALFEDLHKSYVKGS
jgi:hypothetical protein